MLKHLNINLLQLQESLFTVTLEMLNLGTWANSWTVCYFSDFNLEPIKAFP